VLPDLDDLAVQYVEDDRLAVLERRIPVALASRGLEHDDVDLADAGREIALSIQVLGVARGLVERFSGFVGDELFPAFGLPIERF
jgi:hypothetical protein